MTMPHEGQDLGAEPSSTSDTMETSTPDASTEANTVEEGEPNTAEEGDGKAPNREAAKYRTRLREVETERDALRERLDGILRTRAEALAENEGNARLHKGQDLWLGGATLADVLTQAGEIDPAKVEQVRASVVDGRPYLRRAKWGGSADQGRRGTDGRLPAERRMGAIFQQEAH